MTRKMGKVPKNGKISEFTKENLSKTKNRAKVLINIQMVVIIRVIGWIMIGMVLENLSLPMDLRKMAFGEMVFWKERWILAKGSSFSFKNK